MLSPVCCMPRAATCIWGARPYLLNACLLFIFSSHGQCLLAQGRASHRADFSLPLPRLPCFGLWHPLCCLTVNIKCTQQLPIQLQTKLQAQTQLHTHIQMQLQHQLQIQMQLQLQRQRQTHTDAITLIAWLPLGNVHFLLV